MLPLAGRTQNTPGPDAGEAFARELARNRSLAEALDQPDFPLEYFVRLQNWQRDRLARSYATLLQQEETAPAAQFFLQELYGGLNFRERDAEVVQVEPIMRRLLPDRALTALADAMRLQAISLELDRDMARQIAVSGIAELDDLSYTRVYRDCGQRQKRERQVLLIRDLGNELCGLVRMPLLLGLIRMLRGPARAAGFARLQEFLEQGLRAFQALPDPYHFVDTIFRFEWELMRSLFDADPASGVKFDGEA